MFSVVIPLYNKELSIRNTIQSVLDQTCQDFEIVVVNDGSTDNSAAVVEAIEDDRVRLIHQKNQGVSAARNRGIEEARYEWIAFLDGDDLWKQHHLHEVKVMIKAYPNERVYVTSFEHADKRNIFKHSRKQPVFVVENYFKEAMDELLMWTGAVVVHKSCIAQVGGYNENLNRGEDLDLWARLARVYDIVKSQEVTAIYDSSQVGSLSKGKSNYNKSLLCLIDLRGLESFERTYFKRLILKRLKLDIKKLDIKEFFKILLRHRFELFY